MKYGKKRSRPSTNSDESYPKRPREKHGRLEIRNVTRTTRRGEYKNDEEEVEQEVDSEVESADEETAHVDKKEDIPSGAAYNALLTLLKSDLDLKKTAKARNDEDISANDDNSSDEEKEGGEDDEESEAEDEVAGANIDNSEPESDEDDVIDENEDEEETKDPFEAHFNLQSEQYLDRQTEVLKEKVRWPITSKKTYSLGYSSLLQAAPDSPAPVASNDVPFLDRQFSDYLIKHRVLQSYTKVYESLDDNDKMLLDPIMSYKDVNFPYKSFNNTFYRKLYLLHILNHINKTRDRVLKNNNKLHSVQEAIKAGKTGVEEPELRDQGFTRPKVLILLPTRESCYELVEMLIKISGSEQQENKGKLNKQFHTDSIPPEYKPDDFRDAFKGNNNDFFCLGIKFTRKTLKLYSSFYTSDIIIASPIGLSMILENPDKKKRQYDFLSSIEILIIDRAQQIEMQNWDHVNTVLKYVNKIPKEFHDADFSRIRMWSINDQAHLLRQNLVFSEYQSPNINNITTTKSFNLAGKMKFKAVINNDNCIMNSIGLKLKQIFHRFESPSPMSDPDTRFKFFINTILPSLTRTTSYEDGLLIYIPSYYDYLRVKNHMMDHTKLTFGSIDEYCSQALLSRTRAAFASGKIKVLLYTERLHYFRRFEMGGVKNLLMYGLPSNPIFYKELARFIGKSVFKGEADLDLSFMKVMYSKWDATVLERIIGRQRAPVLCNSPNEMFEFR